MILAACSGPTPTRVPREGILAAIQQPLPSQARADALLAEVRYSATDARPWWQDFGDPLLDRLVSTAQAQAFEVRRARASLMQARASLRAAQAGGMPSITLQASQQNEQRNLLADGLGGDSLQSQSSLGLNLDWQLDLFNQIGSSVAAAEARTGSAEALLRDVQRLLTNQIVSSYVQLRSVQRRRQIAEDSERRRADNVTRMNRLVKTGYGTALDLRRAESQLFEARAQREALASAEVQLVNALAVLANQRLDEARALLADPAPLFEPPAVAPLPSVDQLLMQRPDLRARERALTAAAFDVDASKAALYPSMSLGGLVFGSGQAAGLFPSLELLSGRLLANLAWPLLGRGRLLADVDLRTAQLERALTDYEQSVVETVAQIDSALNALKRTRDIHQYRVEAADAAREAETLSHRLFMAGELEYVSVVVAEQTRSAAEDAEVVAQRDAVQAWVDYVSAIAPVW
ncbi:MAG: TolC family protein [Gammaproteobacteria bacterium]|nr:TolC family protein [Gammaproteobacteria bacterium]